MTGVQTCALPIWARRHHYSTPKLIFVLDLIRMKAAKESSPAVQLPVVLHKRLKVYCKKNGLMIKDFVRNAIEQHLAVDVAFRKR